MCEGGTDGFALKGGDSTRGSLMTMYDGPRPDCAIAGTCQRHGNHSYQPMDKKGAIVLATGGDMSNGAMGKFYEGFMVTGVTTDATDDAVQANIVAVGYTNIPSPPPPPAPRCVEVGKSTCYVDALDDRTMGDFVLRSEDITREQCILLCYSHQTALAGVENGNQCMCGNAIKPNVAPSTGCTASCDGNSSETCGGVWALDVMHFTCSSR